MTTPADPTARERANQYLRQQIDQAGPLQQVFMLYDGVVRFMLQAKEAIERGDVQARHTANRRAIEIITYLMGQLDAERDGDAAKSLYRIYNGILKQLLTVDFDNDPHVCDAVAQNFRTLKAGLSQAAAAQAPRTGATVTAAPSAAAGEPGSPASRRNAVA